MTDAEFMRLSRFINEGYGIKLPENKKVMVQARLQKRLRELDLSSYSEYFEIILGNGSDPGEMIRMIDIITTNKTDFFREPAHFNYLQQTLLPEYVRNGERQLPLKIWSAGCSSGEEPYSIAMCVYEFGRTSKGLDFRILGTDLSTRVLKKAQNAVYTYQKTADIPSHLKNKYLLKARDAQADSYRIIPDLREKIYFKRLNFMDKHYYIQNPFDIVFCRNVLIYFERQIQEQVINKLCRHIPSGGYLFLGHSESIMGMKVPLQQIKPTIYRKV